jgi:hypothetical protein
MMLSKLFSQIEKVEGDFKNSKNYIVLSHACQQFRLSIFSRRNNIKSSQLKIYCDDVLVLAKFLLSTAFSTAISSAGEARLTDTILKGFFLKPPSLTHKFPFLSSCFFLSHSLSLSHFISVCCSLSLSLFLQLHLSEVSVVLSLSLSLSLSLKVQHMYICLRAREEQTPKVFCSPKRIQVLQKAQRVVRGLSPPIKKDIRVIQISTREVSVSEGGTFEK